MNPAGKFVGEESVDHPLALKTAEAGEFRRCYRNGEMALAAGSRAGMAGVPVGLIDDLEVVGGEASAKLCFHRPRHGAHYFAFRKGRCQFLNGKTSASYWEP